MKRTISFFILVCALLPLQAQNNYGGNYTRPLSEVMRDVEQRFGVRLKYNVDTAGIQLPFADWRVRPYSIEETLTNICKYFDWNWWKQNERLYKIKPYEYPRRHTDEGARMLAYLSGLYADKQAWEARRDSLRREVRTLLEIDNYMDSLVNKKPVLSKLRRHDGYTVQNICIETLPGEHVFGSIYAPISKGKHPLIICPDGHWVTRSRADEQKRLATLARMGAICVDFDLYGYGQSEAEIREKMRKNAPADADLSEVKLHRTDRAHVMQALNALVLLDYMWNHRKDVDKTRVGVNGGSGGGTHTVLLTVLDDRFTAAAPTVNLASHFDGGCPCESGKPIHRAANGTCNPELLAMFAPHPVQVVSDGGDWTASVPELEYPYLQRIYGFYGAQESVENVHLPKEGHDYGPSKRQANYDFFIRVFGLDRSKLDESKVTIEPREMLETDLQALSKQ
ncbi:MAG: acetylxylan esterase [Prevotella sp.]|nr:acetylxylan esterase [Prevotella sp.]